MITEKTKKEKLLEDYIKLTRKLGKFPTRQNVRKYIGSCEVYERFTDLKKDALQKYPDLENITMPAELTVEDIDNHRFNIEGKKRESQNKNLITNVNTFEYIEHFSTKVFSTPIRPYRSYSKEYKAKKRVLTLMLSDLHFGSDIKAIETGACEYGVTEEARRLAEVIKQTIAYKPQYRNETKLIVNLAGDIIQGKLHDPQDAAPMAEQVCRAIHLLGQALAHLGGHFPEVVVNCCSGNHDRDLNRHLKRATSSKWDSTSTVIYFALKSSLKQFKNVTFNIPKTPYVLYEVFGAKYFLTHGDNVINAGNPGKAINIRNLEFQINRINASLKDNDEVKVIMVGHTHVASISLMNPGTTLLTNGALQPIDQFGISIGILEGMSSQTIFETVPGHPFGDVRFIRVNGNIDKDTSLDTLIIPWSGF